MKIKIDRNVLMSSPRLETLHLKFLHIHFLAWSQVSRHQGSNNWYLLLPSLEVTSLFILI